MGQLPAEKGGMDRLMRKRCHSPSGCGEGASERKRRDRFWDRKTMTLGGLLIEDG